MHIYLENDSINMLRLSRRAENCLKNNGYLTIGDVIRIPIEQLY
jgi:DNA-directed RNA polymerase alpha subunit